jgi:hypothetical protein
MIQKKKPSTQVIAPNTSTNSILAFGKNDFLNIVYLSKLQIKYT